MTKKLSRHQLRERAFQALLSMEFGAQPAEAARFAYLHDREEEGQDFSADLELPGFLTDLVEGVNHHKTELDELLLPKLKKGWTLERLTLIEKTLLRLGLYEILYYPETPDKVALNEIIELTKDFSDPQSVPFINGVLTNFLSSD